MPALRRSLAALLCAALMTLPGCGCGRWEVTLPGGASYQGSEACGWDHGAEAEYRSSLEAPLVVDIGTWQSPPELNTLLNKISLPADDLEVEGPATFEAVMSYSDAAGTHEAALVEGSVEVVHPREVVEDVLLYDEVVLAWDLTFAGETGLAGRFTGEDAVRVIQP